MTVADVVTAVVVLVPSSYLVVRRVRKSARGCEHCRCGADETGVPVGPGRDHDAPRSPPRGPARRPPPVA